MISLVHGCIFHPSFVYNVEGNNKVFIFTAFSFLSDIALLCIIYYMATI